MRATTKIRYNGEDLDLHFNENGNMFYVTDDDGEVVEWFCSRFEKAGPNQCWLDAKVLTQFELKGVVKRVPDVKGVVDPYIPEVVLCDIIHPLFNDQGYSPFGDFCRGRLGQQSQYGSRYIDGRLEGYPALGEGLRFSNGIGYNGEMQEADPRDYHTVRIYRDDMDEFERRYKEHVKFVTERVTTIFTKPKYFD